MILSSARSQAEPVGPPISNSSPYIGLKAASSYVDLIKLV